MTPLAILTDIIKIAKLINDRVHLVKSNQQKLLSLSETVQRVVASLQGLSTLPNQKQFKDSLEALQTCLIEANKFVRVLSKIGRMESFFKADDHAKKIDGFKTRVLELVPLLNIGLAAQQLIDNDRDRQNEEIDRQAFLQQQEQYFRDLQANHLKRDDLEDIICRQLASLEIRLNQTPSALVSPPDESILPEELMVHFYDLVFYSKIGEGDLGALYSGTWRDQPVTIKSVEGIVTERERTQFINEVKRMSKLRNEHIIPFYGACVENHRLCFLTEPMTKGDLSRVLSALSFSQRLRMAKNLAHGLAYLHSKDTVHGDIRPDNVGVNQDYRGKWMNVGLVQTRITSLASFKAEHQEVCWQAPESWERNFEPSTQSDVYGFGCLLWSLMMGRVLYEGLSGRDVMTRVRNGVREVIPDEIPEGCRDLIQACWLEDASQRPSARDIVQSLASITTLSRPRASSPTGEALYERGIKAQEAYDLIEAWALYRRACDKGYIKAFTSVGLFKLGGLGGQVINKIEGIADLKRAAKGGHGRAMYNLGRVYEKGDTEDGKPDYPKALHWYQQALIVNPSDLRCKEKVESLSELLRPENSTYRYRTNAPGG